MKNMRSKLKHVRPSFRALFLLWREEFSFRLQIGAALAAILLSFIVHVSEMEFLIVILMIGAVMSVEALNTAIEELCNHVTPELHPQIGKVKDLASGASALIGTAALIVGLIIFIPHLLYFL